MRDIGLCIMAQNDADLLTDNLQPLREGLANSNDDSATGLARGLRCGLQKISTNGFFFPAGWLRSQKWPMSYILKMAQSMAHTISKTAG
jgi:hypothetical protein